MIRLSIVFVAISISLLAQADLARIVGTVSDPTGAVIPGASITAKDNRTGSLRQATADERGYYVIANISPSDYVVTGKSKDLGPNEYSRIHVSVGQERTLNIVLQPASVTSEITVSGGELSVVDTSS